MVTVSLTQTTSISQVLCISNTEASTKCAISSPISLHQKAYTLTVKLYYVIVTSDDRFSHTNCYVQSTSLHFQNCSFSKFQKKKKNAARQWEYTNLDILHQLYSLSAHFCLPCTLSLRWRVVDWSILCFELLCRWHRWQNNWTRYPTTTIHR